MSQERTERYSPQLRQRVTRIRVRIAHVASDQQVEGTTIAIGTAADNALSVEDPHVSRYHVEFRATPAGIQVTDLGSRNGTWISGLRVLEAVVPSGTQVKVGDTTLEVHAYDTEAVATDDAPEVASILGHSEAIIEVRRTIRTIGPTAASVLIQGETGTGKELVAQAIHAASDRRDGPFVVVDCGSMPVTLVASELFGQERAAFTGADEQRAGAFEQAHGGTIFLDEIGELPIEIQPALLGVLERRRFRRVGGEREIDADVRIVSATHRDLRHQVNEGGFRADLYYRIAASRITIPPLRDRLEDLDVLVAHFLEQLGAPPDAMGETSLAALRQYAFAGNVRELRNIVESTYALGRLQLDNSRSPSGVQPIDELSPKTIMPYRKARAEALAQFEQAYITELYERSQGNAAEAARQAGIDRTYMLKLFKRQGFK